ncbi:MAG: ABC transporter substrate-binding protein [Deltaproteobacteria bacterium]|nr:ABC transporter substrate-binding protein [Deltaproteobacteria bacterium]
MKHFKLISYTLFAFIFIFSFTHCTKKEDKNIIKIGEYGSLTGSEATFGTSTHNGIMLAMDAFNNQGGLNGKKLKVITVDDQGKPEEAASAVTKLITSDKVVALLGEVASSRSLAGAPIAQRYKIPMVTPSSTNPKVTQVGDYIFRTCFIDPFQGQVMANFATRTLKAKKVAVLRDVKSDYSVGLAEFFTKTFEGNGGKVVADLSYTAGDIDFKAQLTAIRSKNVDTIFVPGYYTEVGLIARQAKELGVKVPLLGGDGWDSERLTEIAGTALDNSFFSNHYTSESQDPRVLEFVEKYKKVYGSVPDGLAAMGYDAALVLIDALKRAPNQTPKEIRDALAETKNFQAVTGVISFNNNRDAEKAAVVLEVKNKQFKFVETVNP